MGFRKTLSVYGVCMYSKMARYVSEVQLVASCNFVVSTICNNVQVRYKGQHVSRALLMKHDSLEIFKPETLYNG